MEEMFNVFEPPEAAVLRSNAEAISHLADAIMNVEDKELKEGLFTLISRHSEFLLDCSGTVMTANKMHLKAVN
jgi:hypothetical protein|tara:strand:- start:395 stop:613 length:219 start_codon:yes stop_codon:yes gene_type:complete